MIINFNNKGKEIFAKKKNIISNIRVDKQEFFLAYLLFNGIKKDPLEIGASNE